MADQDEKKKIKINPLQKAKEVLKAISGTPVIDVDSVVDNMLKNTEKRLEQNHDWIEMVRKFENTKDESNSIFSDFIQSISADVQTSGLATRVSRYKEYVDVVKKLPILKKMLRLYRAHILSPDDITKIALRIIPKKRGMDDNENISGIVSKYELIIETLELENKLRELVYKTLFFGDCFVEILSSKKYLMQTLFNLNINFAQNDNKNIRESKDNLCNFLKESPEKIVTEINKDNVCFKIFDTESISSQLKTITEQTSTLLNEETSDMTTDGTLDINQIIEFLPTTATLTNITIKVHNPDKIIVIEDEGIIYGYLFVKGEKLNNTKNINSPNSEKLNSLSKTFTSKLSEYIKNKFSSFNIDVVDNIEPGIQELIADILIAGSTELSIRYIPPSNMQHFKIDETGCYYPYGEGIIDDLMFRARLLLADDTSSVIQKLSAGKRNVITVNASSKQQAMNKIMKAKLAMTKKSITIDKLGNMDSIASIITDQETFYIPRINGEKELEIESVETGPTYEDKTNMIMYQVKQLLTGADIPPPHLGYEEWVNAKATLGSESVVFARNIIDYQKVFSELFTLLLQKIYLALYFNTKDFNIAYKDVIAVFNPPRAILLSSEAEKAQNISTIVSSLKDLDIPKDKIIQSYWPELHDMDSDIENTIDKISGKNKSDGSEDGGDGLTSFMSPGSDMSGGTPESVGDNAAAEVDQTLNNL